MFQKNIDKVLCFPRCNSIHTFFMKCNIDVIMTDKENVILYTFINLKPWKMILPKKGVYYTYEMKAKSCTYQVGDKIKKED